MGKFVPSLVRLRTISAVALIAGGGAWALTAMGAWSGLGAVGALVVGGLVLGATLAARLTRHETSVEAMWSGLLNEVESGASTARASDRVASQVDQAERVTRAREALKDERRASRVAAQRLARQGEFLSQASHELRAPLTSILGFIELLQEPGIPAAQRLECTATIGRAGEHLLRLVNDLLDLAKIDAAHLRVVHERCETAELVRAASTVALARVRAHGLDVRLVVEPGTPRWLHTDALRVRQVLVNLIANAVRFTERGSVEVRVTPVHHAKRTKLASDEGPAARAPGAQVAFHVEDTGPGMDPAQIERAFEPFAQGDGTVQHRFGGTGLGLVISRRLARLLGGDVTVESTPGKGSRFTLTISAGSHAPGGTIEPRHEAPLREPLTPAHGGPPGVPLPLDGRLVLVIDDAIETRRLLTHALDALGADVLVMSDGAAGVREYASRRSSPRPIDVVLMDLHMPGLAGDEATRAIKALDQGARVVALSASTHEHDRQRALEAGCVEYLVKPAAKPDLRDAVIRALNSSVEHQPSTPG